jgi:hypothetical protein
MRWAAGAVAEQSGGFGGAWTLPFVDLLFSKSGAGPGKLYVFFTFSLPLSGVLRTRTSARRENFTFSIPFPYRNRI